MKIVFAGTPEVAVTSLERLAAAGHEIVGVLTREDAPVGRKRVLTPSPVAEAATAMNLPTYKANRLDARATAWVASHRPDLGVVVAYGGLLQLDLLETPKHGWINLHFSRLPAWRGAAPVQRALMNGEEQLGLSVFRLVEALDAGNLVATAELHVPLGTPAGQALADLGESGATLLTDAVLAIETDPMIGTPQEGEATYAHKLVRDDGKLDPTWNTREFIARWAGTTPEPGAYVEHDGQPLKLHDVRILPNDAESQTEPRNPGVAGIDGNVAVLTTGDGRVELVRVQPAGKASMDGAAWLRGRGGVVVLL